MKVVSDSITKTAWMRAVHCRRSEKYAVINQTMQGGGAEQFIVQHETSVQTSSYKLYPCQNSSGSKCRESKCKESSLISASDSVSNPTGDVRPVIEDPEIDDEYPEDEGLSSVESNE